MDKKNLHLEVNARLIRDIDELAEESETTRTTMIERLLREAIAARRNGSDIRSQLREVLQEELVAEQLIMQRRAVRDSGLAWRMLFGLIEAMPDWPEAKKLYESARVQSDTVLAGLTAEVDAT